MDKRIEDATVIAYARRELEKMKEAREEGAEADPGREKLLRDVVRDRIRSGER